MVSNHSGATIRPLPGSQSPDEIDDASIYEGAKKRIVVNAYERDPRARMLCIQHYGTRCFVCRVDLGERYGPVAIGLIDVHHLVPLSRIGEEYRVDPIRDLRPLCPDCHAVIHIKEPPYEIVDIRAASCVRSARTASAVRGAQVE